MPINKNRRNGNKTQHSPKVLKSGSRPLGYARSTAYGSPRYVGRFFSFT